MTFRSLTIYFFAFSALNTIHSQNSSLSKCNFDKDFEDEFYYYIYEGDEINLDFDLKSELVKSIFSIVNNSSRLKMSNIDGISSSSFSLISEVRSKGFLISPKKCIDNESNTIIYINKKDFNSSFLDYYSNEIKLTSKNIKNIINNGKSSRNYNFINSKIREFKIIAEELKFFLPFANSISSLDFNYDIQNIFTDLNNLDIYTLSLEEQLFKLENSFWNLDCKNSYNSVKAIRLLNTDNNLKKKIRELKRDIINHCKTSRKIEKKLQKRESLLFNNLELAIYLQTFPNNISDQLPEAKNLNKESFVPTGRANYFLGLGDSGFRIGPYIKYFSFNSTFNSNKNSLEFSDNMSEAGITLRYRIIRNFLEFEFSYGETLNEIFPYGTPTSETFKFSSISPGIVLGSTGSGFSFSSSVDFLTANDRSDYNYMTARLGINFNFQFKKLRRLEKKKLRDNYENKY